MGFSDRIRKMAKRIDEEADKSSERVEKRKQEVKKGNLIDNLQGVATYLKMRMGKRATVNGLVDFSKVNRIHERRIPTGIATIDAMLRGGWPCGRAAEIFGPEGSGKSAICGMSVIQAQRLEGFGVWLDHEGTVDFKQWPGIRGDRLFYEDDIPTVEATWDYIFALFDKIRPYKDTAGPCFIAWDSIPATMSLAEKKRKKMERGAPAESARAITDGARKAYQELRKVNALLAYVNHEKIAFGNAGHMAAVEPNTPGGKAIKYQTSIRLRILKGKVIKIETGKRFIPQGFNAYATLFKAKTALPHDRALWYMDYTIGPDPAMSVYTMLREWDIVKVQKGALIVPGADGAVSKSVFLNRYRSDATYRKLVDGVVLRGHSDQIVASNAPINNEDDEEDDDGDGDDEDKRENDDAVD